MENIGFAVCYTLLMMAVSAYYYFRGKRAGIAEACMVFKAKEPKAFISMKNRLAEDLNDRTED